MDINTDLIKKEILSLPAREFNLNKLNVRDIKRIKSGRKNYNFRFTISKQKYILRINQFQDYEHSKTEYLNLKLVNKHLVNKGNYPIPICLKKKGKFLKFPYLIITYLEGKEIVLNKNNITLLAKEVAKFSNLKLDKDYAFLKKSNYNEILKRHKIKEKYVSSYSNKLGGIAIAVRKRIEKLKTKDIIQIYQLMHGDLGEGNTLVYKNQIRFIDFEYLKIGDPVLDIAKLSFNNYKDNFSKYKELFFKEYIKQTGDVTIKKRYNFYKHIQVYSWFIADLKNLIKAKQLDVKLISKDIKLDDIKFSYGYLKKNKLINCDLKDITDILEI